MVITNRNWKIEPFRTGRHSFSISHFWFRKFMAWVGYNGYIGQFQTQKHSDLLALIFICIKGYIIWKNCTRNRLDDVAINNQLSFVSGVLWLFIVPFLLLPCSVDPLESNYRENTFPLRSTTMFLGRHFGCRPLDPTLDIWSNFVKKKKKKEKHFTSFLKQTIWKPQMLH